MGGTVNINDLSAVNQGSGGVATATAPDVCLTPAPAGPPIPVPYPNVAMSSDLVNGTTSVLADGMPVAIQGSSFVKSTGDEAGTAGGLMSGIFMSEAKFISFSPNVSMDGKPVCRLTDKMLMNKANTMCGGVVQAPPPPTLPSELLYIPPAKPRVCKFEKLSLACSHGERGYSLNAERQPGSGLQVITSSTAERVEVKFDGSCALHPGSGGCAKLYVIDGKGKQRELPADHKLELPLSRHAQVHDWWECLSLFMRSDGIDWETYTIYGTTCEASKDEAFNTGNFAVVEVFPNVSWSGELEFAYEFEKKEASPKAPTRAIHALQSKAKFGVTGKVQAVYGRDDLSASFAIEGEGATKRSDPLSRALFKRTQQFLLGLARMFRSVGQFYATELNIRWPKIKLAASLELAEVAGKSTVRRKGNFSIAAEPLIGADVKIDILEWLIVIVATWSTGGAGKAFGDYLVQIKRSLAKGKHLDRERLPVVGEAARTHDGLAVVERDNVIDAKLDFGVHFIVGGDVGGALGWEVDTTGVHVDGGKAELKAGLDLKLEAFIKGETSVWILRSAAGASISLQSADGKSPSRIAGVVKPLENQAKGAKPVKGNYFALDGQIDFNGMAIYYALYADMHVEAKVAAPDKPEEKSQFLKQAKPAGSYHFGVGKKNEKLVTLLEPVVWFKEGADVLGAV